MKNVLVFLLATVGGVVGCADDPFRGILIDGGPNDACPEGSICLEGGDDRLPPDRRPDTPDPICHVGEACRAGVCATGDCQPGNPAVEIGGDSDPITGLPPDGMMNSYLTRFFEDGYCTSAVVTSIGDPGACDPNDAMACGDCATCENLGAGMDGRDLSMCLRDCVPSNTTNPCPGATETEGYTSCSLLGHVCFIGCASDTECLVNREDTNGNGVVDDYNMGMGDRLVYNMAAATAGVTCDELTGYCRQPAGSATVRAGDTCDSDFDCEADGRCLDTYRFCSAEPLNAMCPAAPPVVATACPMRGLVCQYGCGTGRGFTCPMMGAMTWAAGPDIPEAFPGGYCTKDGCDTEGRECAGQGELTDGTVCQARRITDNGAGLCLQGCEFAGETDPVMDTHGVGCREGYSCLYGGTGAAGDPNSGGCFPGNYTTVRTANTGVPCTEDSECYSPYGHGFCGQFTDSNEGICTIADCGELPDVGAQPVCGAAADATCVDVTTDGFALCFETCTTPADCESGHGCIDPNTGMGTGDTVCFPACTDMTPSQCRSGEHCEIPPGGMFGNCVPDAGP